MDKISIIIPYRSDHGQRDIVFKWVKKYYESLMPHAELCISDSNTTLFSKSNAVNNAAKKASGNVFVITDADIICSPAIINQSLKKLRNHPWVIPYTKVRNITQKSTKKLLNTTPSWPIQVKLDTTLRWSGAVGGINILPRKHFEAVGGFDERFNGWGGEDDAFVLSVNTICGQFKRIEGDIFHLWHPPIRARGNPNYSNNYKLFKRYQVASGNKKVMKQLINEKSNSH